MRAFSFLKSNRSFTNNLHLGAKIISIFCMITFLLWHSSLATGEEPSDLQNLHDLNNEELLKKAHIIFDNASNLFLDQFRGVSNSEIFLNQAKQKEKNIIVPKEHMSAASIKNKSPLESAQITLDYTTDRLDILRNKFELIQARKANLSEHLNQLETTQTTGNILFDTIDDVLVFYLLEIKWRIDDGSLRPDEVPNTLHSRQFEIQKKKCAVHQKNLMTKIEKTKKELRYIIERVEETKEEITQAETQYSVAKKIHSQELKRNTLEQEYLKKSPDKLLALIPKLQTEKIWLNSTFNQASRKFKASYVSALEIQQQLEELVAPENNEAPEMQSNIHTEETQQAILANGEKIVSYHTNRIEKLQKLQPALESVIKQVEEFEADANIFSDHLFKMQLMAQVIESLVKQGKIAADKVPDNFKSQRFIAIKDTALIVISDAIAVNQYAKFQLNRIPSQIKSSNAGLDDIKNRLGYLKKKYEEEKYAQEWKNILENLTPSEIVQKYKEVAEELQNKQSKLDTLRGKFKKSHEFVEEIEHKFNSLEEPLLRLVKQESHAEKQNILKNLYQFAGLEYVSSDTKVTLEKNEPDSMSNSGLEISDFAFNNGSYQNLLANRIRVDGLKKELQAELIDSLNVINKQFKPYLDILIEVKRLGKKYKSNAEELKKRLSRKELTMAELPDGINEALKQDLINRIEKETTDLFDQQSRLKQIFESHSQADETYHGSQALFSKALNLVGKRLDINEEIPTLRQEFKRQTNTYSETEQKMHEQEALRHRESEDMLIETMLSFVPSQRAKDLTDILQFCYLEIVFLDSKLENLSRQTEEMNRLVSLSEDEKSTLSDLLPFLQKQIANLKIQKEESLAKIQAQLMPQRAEKILRELKAHTGRHIPTPPPISSEYKLAAIDEAANHIFNIHIATVAANKWADLLNQRLTPKGIGAEVSRYQDELGEIDAKSFSITRRMKHFLGHDTEEFNKLSKNERSQENFDKKKFLKGEIGLIRTSRLKVYALSTFSMLMKIIGILIIAVLVTWISNYLIDYFMNRYQEKNSQEMVVFTLLKSVFDIMVWVLAIISILSSLGFEVGAILAGLGIGGLAVAMALKDTLGNAIAGVNILLSKSFFQVGDWIRIGDIEEGQVIGITWRATRIKTRLGHVLSIPNGSTANSVIVNYSDYPDNRYRLEIRLETAPVYAPEVVQKILFDAAISVRDVLRDPPPYIVFYGQGDSSAIYTVQFSTKDYGKRDQSITAVWLQIWEHLERAGIELATPRRELMKVEGEPGTELKHQTPLSVLEESELFQSLSEEERTHLGARMRPQFINPDDFIVRHGDDQTRSLFLIVQGAVGVWITDKDGKSLEMNRIGAGSFFGEETIIDNTSRSADIVAITETFLFEIKKEDLAQFFPKYPEILERLQKHLLQMSVEQNPK